MFSTLMTTRRFAPLFWCQFFSALNDNFVKTALGILILYQIGGTHGPALVTLATAIFIAPFFLLSALGGELADQHDKAYVAERVKLAEIGVAGVAAARLPAATPCRCCSWRWRCSASSARCSDR